MFYYKHFSLLLQSHFGKVSGRDEISLSGAFLSIAQNKEVDELFLPNSGVKFSKQSEPAMQEFIRRYPGQQGFSSLTAGTALFEFGRENARGSFSPSRTKIPPTFQVKRENILNTFSFVMPATFPR